VKGNIPVIILAQQLVSNDMNYQKGLGAENLATGRKQALASNFEQ
jgi:hypothetical protein